MHVGDGTRPEILAGWIPAEIDMSADPPRIQWLRCAGLDWGLPFYDTSIEAYRASGPREERVTGLDALLATGRAVRTLPPNGLFFHTARCGSTVLANMWLALPDPIILKSAQPIDAVLRADLGIDADRRQANLSAVLATLGQPFRGTEQSCWHKLTSWNLLDHALFRGLFPNTPCFFLYRHPVECVIGWLRRPPRMWRFDPVPGLNRSEHPDAEYFARLLAVYLERGLELVRSGSELGSYAELQTGLVPRFLAHFGIDMTDALRAHVDRELSVNAKHRGRAWVPDSEERRRSATPEERAAVERWAMEPYEALERIRLERWPERP